MKRATRLFVALMIVALTLGSVGQAKADFVTVSQSGKVNQSNNYSLELHHFDTSLGALTRVDIRIEWAAAEPGSNVPIGGPSKFSNTYDQSILQTVKADGSPIGSFYLSGSGTNNGNKISFSGHGDTSFNSEEIMDAFSDNTIPLRIVASLPRTSSTAADGTYFRTDRLDSYNVTLTYTYNPISNVPDVDPTAAVPEPSSSTARL